MQTVADQCILISEIKIERNVRQRREIDTSDLEPSIRRFGVLQPILLEHGTNRLIAGERRVETCKKLGLVEIPFRYVSELTQVDRQIIEWTENAKRKDLPWQDNVAAVQRIHQLYLSLDAEWTMAETADALSLTSGTISLYLRVASEIEIDRVRTAGTVREAYNILQRKDNREAGTALEELLTGGTEPELPLAPSQSNVLPLAVADGSQPKPAHPINSIIQADFLNWAPAYSGPRFNFLHVDFPYGVDFASGLQAIGAEPGDIYSDKPEVFWDLLECLCANMDKLTSLSAHMMFWCRLDGGPLESRLRETFRSLAPSWQIWQFPLIWHKTDNAGISSDSRRWPRHVYETCLIASRGKRQIVKIVGDVYGCPKDKSLHVSTKPEQMLRHFMSMLVDEHTLMLDPTAGSGSALRAADSLGAKAVVGLEADGKVCEVANQAWRNYRLLRAGSK